jgi:hypothetical protein
MVVFRQPRKLLAVASELDEGCQSYLRTECHFPRRSRPMACSWRIRPSKSGALRGRTRRAGDLGRASPGLPYAQPAGCLQPDIFRFRIGAAEA